MEKGDFETAISYLDKVIGECPHSVAHICQKLECLVKNYQVKEAKQYVFQIGKTPPFEQNRDIFVWRARILMYAGEEVDAQKILRTTLELDKENQSAKHYLQNIQKAADLKKAASEMFQAENYEGAVHKFKECLQIDPLNVAYNSVINMNLGLCLHKLKKNDDALDHLNKSIKQNPEYVKAYVNRASVNDSLGNY
mmetsp:Transcript_27718/g.20816  ORF Transcript_27718/g.20816 Transcript_27718/m.20816 type:complete len:195 (+) Transcript_27718:385-969(+)